MQQSWLMEVTGTCCVAGQALKHPWLQGEESIERTGVRRIDKSVVQRLQVSTTGACNVHNAGQQSLLADLFAPSRS